MLYRDAAKAGVNQTSSGLFNQEDNMSAFDPYSMTMKLVEFEFGLFSLYLVDSQSYRYIRHRQVILTSGGQRG